MKTIIVTGGLGYIGSSISYELALKGYRVIIIDDFSNSEIEDLDHLNSISPRGSIKFLASNLQNVSLPAATLTGWNMTFDGLIHMAAHKSVDESVENPLMYYKNNLGSMMGALELCERLHIKNFIFSSSASVYGNSPESSLKESHAKGNNLECAYSMTKWMGEEMLRNYTQLKPLKGASLRYFNPIGATVKIDDSGSVMSNLVKALETKEFKIFGGDYDTKDGSCVRDYIDIRDLVDAHIHSIEFLEKLDKIDYYGVFNVGTGVETTVKELTTEFLSISNADINVEVVDRRAGDTKGSYAEISKINNTMNWSPKHDVKSSIENLLKTKKNFTK